MMKIFQIIQKPQLRGAEIFASQLSNHLINLNHDVTLISIFSGTVILQFDGKHIALDRPTRKRLWDPKGWYMFARIVRSENPDIIQVNVSDTLKFAVFSKKIFGWRAPIIYRNASRISYFIDSKLKLLFNSILIQHVDHVVSVSEVSRKDFIKTFPFKKKHVSTIEIGIDLREIGPLPMDLHPIFTSGPVIIHVGALEVEKNHRGLMRIFKTVKGKIPDAQLVIIGAGSLFEDLKNYAESLDIVDSVHFIGRRLDVLEIVKRSQAFLLPSLIEGMPGVILESMYCKTPVIAYDVGGVSEVVLDDTGWLVEKDDEIKFAQVTLEVLTNQEKVKPKLSNAYERVTRFFSNNVIAHRFAEIYADVKRDFAN